MKAGHLKEFLVDQRGGDAGQGLSGRNDCTLPPSLGIIEVILAALRGISWSNRRAVLSVVSSPKVDNEDQLEKKIKRAIASITFRETNLERKSQPHNDTLVVTCRIGGFLVKKVMVDRGSGAEIMYPDLYKKLGLKFEDLSKYDTPLVGFSGKVVTPEG